MGCRRHGAGLMLGAAATALMLAMQAAPALAQQQTFSFDIPPQDLGSALMDAARISHQQVTFSADAVRGKRSPALKGEYAPRDAIDMLLAGSGLAAESGRSGVFVVRPTDGAPGAPAGPRQASPDAAPDAGPRSEASPPPSTGLEEIVVTASRREQLAQQTTGALQVFGGEKLQRLGANGYQDYLLQVPGVSFRDQGTGSKRIALRSVSNASGSDFSSGAAVSTVGLYVDDVPIQGTSVMADMSLYDLNRVEVLKGPQGTLYGEGAMGGAIKMVLNQPDPSAFAAKGDATVSNTQHGGWNYRIRGAVNLPLVADKVAVRLAATYREDSGYIDNVFTGARNTNDETAYSLRGLLSAQLTEALSATLMIISDRSELEDFSQEQKALGDLKILAREDNYYIVNSDVYALTLKYDSDFAQLSSVTSYYESKRDYLVPYPLASLLLQRFSPAPLTESTFNLNDLSSFAQEVRLVSSGDHRFDWIVGAFYRSKKQDADSQFRLAPAELPVVNAGLAAIGRAPYENTLIFQRTTRDQYKQYAVYAEGSFELTPRLELSVGVRYYDEKSKVRDVQNGFGFTSNVSVPALSAEISDNGFIPKISLAFKPNPNQLYYVLASKGFRSSTLNFNVREAGGLGAKSDTLWNYEVGAKTQWADNRLQVNATGFYIDWTDIQASQQGVSRITGLPRPFVANGGDAVIYGAEIEVAALPVPQLQLGLSTGYTHSELTDRAASTSIEGAVLPNSPRWTASGFAEYRAPLASGATLFARLDMRYSARQATRLITPTSNGFFLKPHTTADIRMGVEFAERGTLTLFVTNLGDERSELGRGLTGASAFVFTDRIAVDRPRTFGVTYSVAL